MKSIEKNRLAGLLVPAFALRREDDLGIGDTQAVKESIDFCAHNEIAVLQLLPINETGGDNSPYNAVSAFALDPALLTVSPNTVPGLGEDEFQERATSHLLRELRCSSVNYPAVKKLKLDLLNTGFTNLVRKKSSPFNEIAAFERFKQNNRDWLENYAVFRTLVDEHEGNACWTSWKDNQCNPEAASQWILKGPDVDRLQLAIEFWSFVQWLAANQWQEVKAYAKASGISLMADIPFGVSRYSADVWANQHLFDLNWCGGAPPERFFQGDEFTRNWGQNWGIPLYNWQIHKKDNFTWWRKRIAHVTRYCHYFRIDHVLGFFRIYAFPWPPEQNQEFAHLTQDQVKTVTGGRLPHFVPRDDYPTVSGLINKAEGKELLTMVIEAAGDTGIVAEDLGLVPDYLRPLLRELGIPGFSIPIFEREPDQSFKPKESLPALSLCTYGTHDHEPIAAYYENLVKWWHGSDGDNGWLEVQRLMDFLGLKPADAPSEYTPMLQFAFFKTLLQTPCWLAVVMITDLLGTKQRFNEPGLAGNYNWSQRLDWPIGRYETDESYATKINYFKKLIVETNRSTNCAGSRKTASCQEIKN